MRNSLASLLLVLLASYATAKSQEIAVCRSPEGMGYFHYTGLLKEADAGWAEEKITNGAFTLTQDDSGQIDILYVDAWKKPVSSANDGALVRLLRRGEESITVIAHYPETSTEIYTFFREKSGAHRFTLLQSRTGSVVAKSSLMMGYCDPIKFQLLK